MSSCVRSIPRSSMSARRAANSSRSLALVSRSWGRGSRGRIRRCSWTSGVRRRHSSDGDHVSGLWWEYRLDRTVWLVVHMKRASMIFTPAPQEDSVQKYEHQSVDT